MPAREYCVYNETRENFLMPRVTVLDTKAEPLKAVKVLIEGLAPGSETGLWLHPLKSVPTVPRLSGYDLVYLDPQCRVLNAVALGADDDVPRINDQTASALVLPIHTFSASSTHPGDKVVLHATDEFRSSPEPAPCASPAPPQLSLPDEVPASALAPLARRADREAEELPLPRLLQPEVLPPAPAAKGLSLLRSIVHLRIHISISITTTPAVVQVGAPSDAATFLPSVPASGALRARVATLAGSCAGTLHSAAAGAGRFLGEHSRAGLERCAIWKRRYMRWAEVVVYGAPQIPTRVAVRALGRSPRLEEEC